MNWQEVDQALTGIEGTVVAFSYPQTWNDNVTTITYRQSNQVDVAYADDVPYITQTDIAVDVWDLNPARVNTVAAEVRQRLAAIDFRCTLSADLYEEASSRHHRTEQYTRDD